MFLTLPTFVWATTLAEIANTFSIQQPLWWALVLLWAVLIIFITTLQVVQMRYLCHTTSFERRQQEAPPQPSQATVLQRAEFIVDGDVDQFTLIAPQVAAALELPFRHMGVRTENHRQEIEKAVNALYCIASFDEQALSNCLQQLLQAAKQNWMGLAAFSPREREILELLLQNISYKEMSSRLYVSTSTIKSHVYHIFQKLGISNREEAIYLIRERGWFSTQESIDMALSSYEFSRERASIALMSEAHCREATALCD